MRVLDSFIKSVGFVSRKTETPVYRGTAFIVNVPMNEKYSCLHLVTAKHVAEQVGKDCLFAFNGKDGEPIHTVLLDNAEMNWFYHQDPSVDAAVLPFGTNAIDMYDVKAVPTTMFATTERIAEYNIGIGDEVFSIGLFTKFYGNSPLSPILRTGNIAMMPKEKVPIAPSFGKAEAFLIEGRSIGGLSGSPVFCRSTNTIHAGFGGPGISGLGSELHFLGLMHGHWDVPAFDISATERQESVNMGISIVVPASKILEVLFSEALVEMRNKTGDR